MIKTIIVKNTCDQKMYTFENVEVSVLKDVKNLLTEKGVGFSGLDFHVGFANIVLLEDNSPIPEKIIKRDGTEITDKVVFLLTNSTNKIKSGAMTRAEAYAKIMTNPNLKDTIKSRYSRNYTQVSTENLAKVIEEFTREVPKVLEKADKQANEYEKVNNQCDCTNIKAAIRELVRTLVDEDVIYTSQAENILALISPEGDKADNDTDALLEEALREANL